MEQDFDDDGFVKRPVSTEFDDEDGGIDTGASSLLDSVEAGEAAEEFVANIAKEQDESEQMSEAERRFDMAGYYRLFLRQSLFESEEASALLVEAEFKAFAEGRLQALLGIRTDNRQITQIQPVVKPQFTDEEAATLRRFAAMSETEQKVFWALLQTAARSKTVMGAPPPAKPQPAPAPAPAAKVRQAPPVEKKPPTMRRIASPGGVAGTSRAPAPTRQPAAAQTRPAPRQRQQAPVPEEPPAAAPPKPIAMPRGKAMEGVMMHTAISQSASGEKMDETYRRRGDPDGVKVAR